ncbi:MAG TPA: 23S rRNA (uracil(1939)-C(5))-methyltransferase RlmD [Burkholderiaceae bacterium]|nr:23S rRNA (uracil(1939)-C(5))-methyltransferase RlmD [Burkholderiaceae bacterium]HQR69154.1 23S rRNA (uracil(1939)-C(5))-methyltransferase RlmD [Burkholderiaceae bacterium]
MSAGDTFQVEIESLDQEGRGVGHRDGKAVFVEGALPGERVRYERRRNKPSYETGRVLAIDAPSVLRTQPKCPHFGLGPGACGGCSMQHLEPRAQVSMKQRVLEDGLWHIGRLRPERMLRPIAGPSWNYRYRARLSVRNVPKKGGVLVGFHERASSYVADMTSCQVLPEEVSRLIVPLRRLVEKLSVRERLPQVELAAAATDGNELQIVLVLRVLHELTADDRARLADFAQEHHVEFWLQPGGPATAAPLTAGQPAALDLRLPEFGVSLQFRPTDFTQVNHRMNAALVGRAIRLLDPAAGERVVDFFCGLGNFTLPLATRAAHVVGYEGSDELVERARAAARDNGLAQRTTFTSRNLFEWSEDDWHATLAEGRVDKVLIDPPREGALAVARTLASTPQRPARVVYVSCNPATLARDCAVLVHEGGWALRAAGVLNMFPHTSHVESLAVLEPGRG